jgi:argininosuccinate lyase
VALHLQSLATDVIGFAGTSLMWVKYPEAFGTGSSMMPNKANPDAMELLRGTSNELLAAHGHALLLLKGLPSGYNRDLQCLKPIVRDAAESAVALVDMTTAFVGELSWNADRLAASLGQGAIDATLRMEDKVRGGMPLRDAHHATAEEVLAASGGAKGGAASAFGADRYVTIGCASPAEVRRVAAELLGEVAG